MPQWVYGLVEMSFVYIPLLAFLVWQLVKTRASLRADRERAAREKAEQEIGG